MWRVGREGAEVVCVGKQAGRNAIGQAMVVATVHGGVAAVACSTVEALAEALARALSL